MSHDMHFAAKNDFINFAVKNDLFILDPKMPVTQHFTKKYFGFSFFDDITHDQPFFSITVLL